MSLFTEVVAKIPKRNAFNLSFESLLTAEFGQLFPVSCKEILPHDSIRQSTEVVVKTAPMLAPIFSRIDLYLHYFFVPCRLLQSDWEDFITTGVDGLSDNMNPPFLDLDDAILYSDGQGSATAIVDGSLADYMNLPKVTAAQIQAAGIGNLPINMLPFLCYQKIYSDWFKDELLDQFEFEPIQGGNMSASDGEMAMTMRYRSWKKDYFTSARPNTQLGAPIPIPISGDLSANGVFRLAQSTSLNSNPGLVLQGASEEIVQNPAIQGNAYAHNVMPNVSSPVPEYYQDGISLDAAGIDVNDLRRALRLAQWQERNMRGGNRYIENIYHHFGVKSSDARLQRSELLGGRKIPIVISEVTQQSNTTAYEDTSGEVVNSTPLGQLAGKAGSVGNSGRIKWHAEEHGFLMCVASIMPKAGYMQGLPRMYWRQSYLDYAWPLFGNLGEQEVYNGEIYLPQANAASAFGYQSRYAEYKFSPNEVHGAFRSSMAYWHNARIFDSAPNLNNDFVQLNGGQDDSTNQGQNRIFPTLPDGYGHFYLHLYHDIRVIRALPKYGIPSI